MKWGMLQKLSCWKVVSQIRDRLEKEGSYAWLRRKLLWTSIRLQGRPTVRCSLGRSPQPTDRAVGRRQGLRAQVVLLLDVLSEERPGRS